MPKETAEEKINFVKRKSIVVEVSSELAEHAVDISMEHDLPMADSIIYASSLENNCTLYTLDNHFRKLPRVNLLEESSI